MSTLKVDTIQPNAQAAVSVDSAAIVTGTSTLQGNVTAQGNLDVSGTLATSGTLTATRIALAGASSGGSGTINGVSTLNCQGVTASGTVSAATMAASGNVSCGSLTVDGETFRNRVTNHVSIAFSADVTGAIPTNVDLTAGFHFRDNSSNTTITLSNNHGISSVSWQSGGFVGGRPIDKLRIQLSVGVPRPQQIIHMQFWDSGFTTQEYRPRFRLVSNTVIEVLGWSLTSPTYPEPIRYLTMAMIG